MNMERTLVAVFLCFITFSVLANAAQRPVLYIYHDSDYSSHSESAEAMKMGFNSALRERNFEVQGFRLQLLEKDHRGNSNRSLLTMRRFLKDERALLMLGGLHSPPYIKHRDYINQQGILLLVPWAAGGPVTRYPDTNNWVFRLSIDDTKAGLRLVEFARQKQCRSPHMLLERTPWGKSNYQTITRALSKPEAPVTWFNWNMKMNATKIMLREIVSNGHDCVIFVGNALEGKQLVKAVGQTPKAQRPAIISHWGITGGNFFAQVAEQLRAGIDLHFLQSCFSFQQRPHTEFVARVWQQLITAYPDKVVDGRFIQSPAGFIHGYDLGRVLLGALDQISLSGKVKQDRAALRSALENLKQPVQGLIKVYKQPFSPWSESQPDAHEALGLEDICMASYNTDGSIKVLKNQ
ncbi:ABC transporter substrate-binding protein [Pseudoalteromonas rubra]|nr:ABC transporter substrate-binding protein [Pseudoalteromonas rubra]